MSKPPLPDFVSDDTFTPAAQPEPQAETAPAAEAQAPEDAPAPSGPARGTDGKFVASTPAEAAPAVAAQTPPADPAPPAQPAPAAPAQPAAEPFAPLAALLDEREKRQAAEKRAKELEDWRSQQEAQLRRQPIPDPTTDPTGYQAFQAEQLQAVLWDQKLEMSRGFAEVRHGPEATQKAFEWGVQRCDADPYFNAKVRSSKDPVGFVVSEWRREQTLSQLSDFSPEDVDAFRAWKAAQAAAPAAPAALAAPQLAATAQVVAPPAQPAAPRPSLAAAPSASGSSEPLPLDGEATFNRMFSR